MRTAVSELRITSVSSLCVGLATGQNMTLGNLRKVDRIAGRFLLNTGYLLCAAFILCAAKLHILLAHPSEEPRIGTVSS